MLLSKLQFPNISHYVPPCFRLMFGNECFSRESLLLSNYHRNYSFLKRLTKQYQEVYQKAPKEYEVFFPSINPNGISGKVALVLGGSSGAGLSCVHQLLSNGAKAVMIADSDEKKGRKLIMELCRYYGLRRASFIRTCVDNVVLMRHAYNVTKTYWKGLDIVVNNTKHVGFEDWEQQIDHSIKGVVRATLLAIEHMGTHNGGSGGVVVNIVTKGAKTENVMPLYHGARYFTKGFDKSIAKTYYKRTGVKVLSLVASNKSDECGEDNYDIVRLLSRANYCVDV